MMTTRIYFAAFVALAFATGAFAQGNYPDKRQHDDRLVVLARRHAHKMCVIFKDVPDPRRLHMAPSL